MRVLSLLLALGLSSCAMQREILQTDELQRVVWYMEDVAHGLPRHSDELVYEDASAALQRLARWASGDQRDGVQVAHPPPLAARRARWSLLQEALSQGLLAYSESGQLHLRQASDDRQQRQLRRAVEQENLDRASTAELLLGLGELRAAPRRSQAAIAAFQQARRHHAVLAGGHLWTAPSSSTSPTGATPSTSPAEPSLRRER